MVKKLMLIISLLAFSSTAEAMQTPEKENRELSPFGAPVKKARTRHQRDEPIRRIDFNIYDDDTE